MLSAPSLPRRINSRQVDHGRLYRQAVETDAGSVFSVDKGSFVLIGKRTSDMRVRCARKGSSRVHATISPSCCGRYGYDPIRRLGAADGPIRDVDGSAAPLRGPGSGVAGVHRCTAAPPLGGRCRPNPSPCGKAAEPMWNPGTDDSSGRRRNGWFPHRQGRQFRQDLGLHVSIRRLDHRPGRAAHKIRYPESADRRAPRTRRMPIPMIVNTDSGARRPAISGGGQLGRSEATTAISTFDYVCGSFLAVRHTVHREVGSLPSMSNPRQSSAEVS